MSQRDKSWPETQTGEQPRSVGASHHASVMIHAIHTAHTAHAPTQSTQSTHRFRVGGTTEASFFRSSYRDRGAEDRMACGLKEGKENSGEGKA